MSSNIRHTEEQKEYYRVTIEDVYKTDIQSDIVFHASWKNGKLKIFSKVQTFSMEELEHFFKWVQRTKPTPRYRIKNLFDFKPDYMEISNRKVTVQEYDDKQLEIEEIWE